MPVTDAAAAVVERAHCDEALEQLMRRPLRHETD
jgi:hypothetical protein